MGRLRFFRTVKPQPPILAALILAHLYLIFGCMGPSETSPSPVPRHEVTGTPDSRDEQRLLDLNTIAALLEEHRAEHGSFPQTRGIQTVCRFPNDVACTLREYSDPLPRDPLTDSSYWYVSDGERFTLFAAMEVEADTTSCPSPFPDHLADVELPLCLRGPL